MYKGNNVVTSNDYFVAKDHVDVNISVLDNGITVISQYVPNIELARVNVTFKVGSVLEQSDNSGICHFVEHMLFKGSQKYSGLDISRYMELLGCDLNAYTSYDSTSYYFKCLASNMEESLEILSNMIKFPRFNADDIDMERNVIMQELATSLDNQEEVAYEQLKSIVYGKSSMAESILGSYETLDQINQEKLISFYDDNYSYDRMSVQICSNQNHMDNINMVNRHFTSTTKRQVDTSNLTKDVTFHQGIKTKHKSDCEQSNIVIAIEGLNQYHERYIDMVALSYILGGGTFSYLFQELREKQALTYSTYSYVSLLPSMGYIAMYSSAANNKVDVVIDEMLKQLKRLSYDIDDDSIRMFQQTFLTNFAESNEVPYLDNQTLFSDYTTWNRIRQKQEYIDLIMQVNKESLLGLAQDIVNNGKLAISIVGSAKKLSNNLDEYIAKIR